MARTQILKDIRPDIFLSKGKVFGILFLLMSQIIFAHVRIATKPDCDFAEEKTVSDSTREDRKENVKSDEIIYITSGTTIVNFDDTIEGKIVVVQSPKTKSEKQHIVKKGTTEKVVELTSLKKTVAKNPESPTEYYYPSNKTDLHYSTKESFIKAVVPSTDSHSKFFIKPITRVNLSFLFLCS